MRTILMLTGAAAMLAASPALAQPGKVKVKKNSVALVQPGCPPGLAKKRNGCLPPGQAKKIFEVGQRIPTGYGYFSYDRIPLDIRNQYDLRDDYRYIYRDQHLYVVDPTTRLVTSILNAIL